jgi:predicted RNase H-like HicB family nuclease
MDFEFVFEREKDGRWIGPIDTLSGVLAYGASQQEAKSKVEARALGVIADRIEVALSAAEQVRFATA